MPPKLDFYKIATQAILLTMSGYSSLEREYVLNQIHKATEKTRILLSQARGSEFSSLEDLQRIGVYKPKYIPYSTFFAVISSYPTLKKVAPEADLADAILAKVSGVLSIKVLDNINDDLHTIEQAAESLDYQEKAFLEKAFYYRSGCDPIVRAENCTYLMARWNYGILSEIADSCSLSYKVFKEDMHTYISGQKESFYQRMDAENKRIPQDLKEYLSSTCEKGIGNIWFDVDLCYYEKNNGGFNDQEFEMASNIRKGMELAYKSALLYDDVSDLRDDLAHRIVNSVVLYAADHGLLTLDEACRDIDTTMLKLEKAGVLRDIIHLGDLMFLKSIRHLEAIKKATNKSIDIDGISFGFRVLRAFTMRKWIYRERSITSIGALARSFHSSDKLSRSIPERLLAYEEYIE